jgi:hypothetical protein
MTDHETRADSNGPPLEDVQVENLLREFFRHEVPRSLEDSCLAPGPQITLAADPQTRQRGSGFTARRIVTTTALASLAVAMFVLSFAAPQPTTRIADSDELTEEAVGRADEQLLLVSPEATSKQHTVSEDGLLLQETDQIDLNPKPQK